MNGITIYRGFKTTDGIAHDSKLKALIAQHAIDLRAIVQSDEKYGKPNAYTASQVADIVARNSEQVNKTNTYYKVAINRERTKESN